MSKFVMSDGWSRRVEIPEMSVGTQSLAIQVKLLGKYIVELQKNPAINMSRESMEYMNALHDWLSDISEQFKESDIIVLQENPDE